MPKLTLSMYIGLLIIRNILVSKLQINFSIELVRTNIQISSLLHIILWNLFCYVELITSRNL